MKFVSFSGVICMRVICTVLILLFSQGLVAGEQVLIQSSPGFGAENCPIKAELELVGGEDGPIVIIVHGSGPLNREGQFKIGEDAYTPYLDISTSLAEHNISTLRYDKRTADKECVKKIDWLQFSPNAFVNDVENIVLWLARNKSTKEKSIILLGHSQGVNFVTTVANRQRSLVKAIVLMAGLVQESIDSTIIRQLTNQLTLVKTPEEKKFVARFIAQAEDFFIKLRNNELAAENQFMGVFSVFWKDWITITEIAALEAMSIRVPSLVMQGDLDQQVLRSDFLVYQFMFQSNQRSKAMWYEGINHYFTTSNTTAVDSLVQRDLVSWINSLKED